MHMLSAIAMSLMLCWASLIFKYLYSYTNNENAWYKIRRKWVVVTNATTELGKAFCKVLAQGGCKLIIIGSNEELLNELKASLEQITTVESYAITFATGHDYSFLERYDIGMVVNKIGFQVAEPNRFIDLDIDHLIDNCLRGPLQLIKIVMGQMAVKQCGYILNIGLTFTDKPRAYYSLITSIKALFRSWSESMYYEMKDYKVNVEYMDSGMIALRSNGVSTPGWFSPTPEKFAESVFRTFGNSYFTVPHFSHFIMYLGMLLTPRFIVGRYRKRYVNRFSKKIESLY